MSDQKTVATTATKFRFLAILGMALLASASARADTAAAAFDINKIPVTNKNIGVFPFFTPPAEHKYTSWSGSAKLDENVSLKKFTRHYYAVGKESLHPVEGKTLKTKLYNEERKSSTNPDTLVIRRNYENAITAAGGVKIFDGKPDRAKTYGALEKEEKFGFAPEINSQDDIRQVYVIRRPDAEIWIEVSCGVVCYYNVTQKGEMKQSVGTVRASVMKEALDKEGHIALYIHFDIDKAIIRPESQDTVNEIAKLLESNPGLKIRIEGHTDDTGDTAHNKTLSENRAAAVYGSLLARGIAQNRLESRGFGAARPIVDNQTEEGRARNRRVEIVKIS